MRISFYDGRTDAESMAPPAAQRPDTIVSNPGRILKASEAEVVSASCGTGQVVRLLAGDLGELIEALPQFGPVKLVVQNAGAIHEKMGHFLSVKVNGSKGLVLGPSTDLRLSFEEWAMGFAIREDSGNGLRRGLHFFDDYGDAVLKIILLENGPSEAFEDLAARLKCANQAPLRNLPLRPAPDRKRDAGFTDPAALHEAWDSPRSMHDFFASLHGLGISHARALQLAGPPRAQRVSNRSLRKVLAAAATLGLPLMVCVGNEGAVQIHMGPMRRVDGAPPRLNILDPDFNLHLREDCIASTWILRKPTWEGLLTGLVLFDAGGKNLLLIFGRRAPGEAESEVWRRLLAYHCERDAGAEDVGDADSTMGNGHA
jgi:putative hemin transport protein